MNLVVDRLSQMDIDVFVPLYANTFPLATIAKKACKKAGKNRTISIEGFDWNWSKSPPNDPPFPSSRPFQLFFATKSEFRYIHQAGISFFAVPVSVFHPKYIFLGLPPDVEDSESWVKDLRADIELAFRKSVAEGGKPPSRLTSQKRHGLTWVSDIPDQAEMLSSKVQSFLDGRKTREKLVNFWQSRPIEDALNAGADSKESDRQVKAFIWGGPLASVYKNDANRPNGVAANQMDDHSLRMRDPERQSSVIELGSLSEAFKPEEIDAQHALYCCIGYKETGRLRDYYVGKQNLDDMEPWSLESKKFAALQDSGISDLALEIGSFFECLFAATSPTASAGVVLFEEFKSDYNKFCRTLNPVAQLYATREYIECLYNHHDAVAFNKLFRRSSTSSIV